jgi:hypothetical protein
MAVLLMLSMALSVHSIRITGFSQSGKKDHQGAFGAVVAMLASFYP